MVLVFELLTDLCCKYSDSLLECHRTLLWDLSLSSVNLRFIPFLGSIVLLYTPFPRFWPFGLVPGFDFHDQCSVDILFSACESFSKENNWEGDCRVMEHVHIQLYQTVPNHFPDDFYPFTLPSAAATSSSSATAHKCRYCQAFSFLTVWCVRGLVMLLNLHFFDD